MPSVAGRTIAITGAARGMGAALAMDFAGRGAFPVLLGRGSRRLGEMAVRIEAKTGQHPPHIVCDLADHESAAAAGKRLVAEHPSCDGLIHNGAMWSPKPLADLDDSEIFQLINAATTGAMVLTRQVLDHFRRKPRSDILTVASLTGLLHAPLRDSSAVFKAAKAGQDAFIQGLAEETRDTAIRVSGIHPGYIRDLMPDETGWDAERGVDDPLTHREVVDAIRFMLEQPLNAAVRALHIERNTDYLLAPNEGDAHLS